MCSAVVGLRLWWDPFGLVGGLWFLNVSARFCVGGDIGSLASRDKVGEEVASAVGLLFFLPAGVISVLF